jgi:hypothetical protein
MTLESHVLPIDVREEEDFIAHGIAIFGSVRLLDDVTAALKWAVARQPDFYPLIAGTLIHVAHVGVPGTGPEAWAFYHHEDATCCTLLDVILGSKT